MITILIHAFCRGQVRRFAVDRVRSERESAARHHGAGVASGKRQGRADATRARIGRGRPVAGAGRVRPAAARLRRVHGANRRPAVPRAAPPAPLRPPKGLHLARR